MWIEAHGNSVSLLWQSYIKTFASHQIYITANMDLYAKITCTTV